MISMVSNVLITSDDWESDVDSSEVDDENNFNGVECFTSDEWNERDDGWECDVISPDDDDDDELLIVIFADKRVINSWYDLSELFCLLYKYFPNSVPPITPITEMTKTVILIKVTEQKYIFRIGPIPVSPITTRSESARHFDNCKEKSREILDWLIQQANTAGLGPITRPIWKTSRNDTIVLCEARNDHGGEIFFSFVHVCKIRPQS
jgi:hypothetical protein